MRVGVVGASGYAGGELLRLLAHHPTFVPEYIAAGSSAGEPITSIHSHLSAYSDQVFAATDVAQMNKLDLLFLALPHGESAHIAQQISPSVKIVDLGADFRLNNSESWKKYYGSDYAGRWIYGLPEIPNQREVIAKATRIANPGCYATAIALAAAPAVRGGVIDSSDIVVVAASGTTGAGRSTKISLSASEIMNSMVSYKFGGVHQHTPEIEETLQLLTSSPVTISFTPILAPMPRGILATVTAKTTLKTPQLREMYEAAYATEKFVTLLPESQLPETSSLIGSNSAHLQVACDPHSSRAVISIAIDNLGKGAAGQAIQNANLISGLPEDSGLPVMGMGQ
jgi:N-acetyl-gamma-glutamyl-phosphate reductase